MAILNEGVLYNELMAAGLLGNQNVFFSSFITPSVGQFAVLGTFAGVLNQFSGYVINATERGIGILPISSLTGKFMPERAVMLPYQYIARVEAKNGGVFAYKKIDIITVNNEKISFKVVKKVLANPNHFHNVNYFLNMYHLL